MKVASGVSLLFVAFLAIKLAPYRYTMIAMVTMPFGYVPLKTDCGDLTNVPKLQLTAVAECTNGSIPLPKDITEPCVVRGGVSAEIIQAFLGDIYDQPFMMEKDFPSKVIGNPCDGRAGRAASRVFEGEHVVCTTGEIVDNDPRCAGAYMGFRSLNFSHFAQLDNSFGSNFHLEDHERADIFLGNLPITRATASIHANQFEESTTLQLVGSKLWLLPSYEDMYGGHFDAYNIGAFDAPWNACPNQLDQVELMTVLTHPGDALVFPKAHAHMIYTTAGPNFMINFRRSHVAPFSVLRDTVALASAIGHAIYDHILNVEDSISGNRKFNRRTQTAPRDFCAENGVAEAASSFGHGHPNADAFFVHQRAKDIDFRCHFNVASSVQQYAGFVEGLSLGNDAMDEAILSQVLDFNLKK